MSPSPRLLSLSLLLSVALTACPGPEPTSADCAADSECDDQNACTADRCSAGECKHTQVGFDDGDECTADACDPATGVTHTPVSVDDGNACTVDACDPLTGVSHTPASVSDGDACTEDACDPVTGVSHVAVAVDDGDACTVDACDTVTGVSHVAVAVDDGSACTVDACDPATGVSHVAVAVDDGDACTVDACDPTTGVSHTAVAVDDGNACTVDACDPTTGVSHVAVVVDDGNACTVDACDPATGLSHVAVAVDDGNACTVDACDPVTGVSHVAVVVDDGDACTVDACDPATGVSHLAVVVDDGNACTVDSCDPATGPAHTALNVDDNNACTVDSCDPATGPAHVAVNVDDHDVCTTDSCDPQTGLSHVAVAVDDGDACTTDACDPSTGITHTPVVADDFNACTTDTCDPATGPVFTLIDVDDGSVCTVDACDALTGPIHTAVDPSDGNACTIDACHPVTGVSNTAVDPDDDDACTTDSCDPAGGPVHTLVNVDDGNACTADACDPATGVLHTPIDPDDDNACTTDTCDPATGPTHTLVSVDDGNACTTDTCDPSSGVAHTPVSTDDGLACTTDSCDPVTGPAHRPNNFACAPAEACVAGQGCVAAAAHQSGAPIVSEFQALGAEFIELHNPGANAVDVQGFVFANAAGQLAVLHSVSDPTGMSNAPISIPAGGTVYGIPNPSAGTLLPAEATFVYGEQGTSFNLADTGDVLSLHLPAGAGLVDLVDFRSFVTDPDAVQTATSFPGVASASTQLGPHALSAAGNDDGGNWCTTFYPASGARARVVDTRGSPNGGCRNTAVLNELLADAVGTDDGLAFIELAGPGGAPLGGVRITDIEGVGTSSGKTNASDIVLPAGLRMPVDGILLVADGTTGGVTLVSGMSPADVIVPDADLENGGGDSVQLIAADGTLLDAVGHQAGTAISLAVAENGYAMYEGTPALTTGAGVSLARSQSSADTGDNRADLQGDPTPTPGSPNGPVAVSVTSISPGNTLAGTSTTAGVVLSGTDFAPGVTVQFGTQPATCTREDTTRLVCQAPANATVGAVDVQVTNPASAAGSAVRPGGFTYTGVLNETGLAGEADWCIIQWPYSLTLGSSQTADVYAQIWEDGVTAPTGAPTGLLAELGFAPSTSPNPTTDTAWRFFAMAYQGQVGNNDEFVGTITAPAVTATTTYQYAVRFSLDGGLNWTYCDLDGAGSNAGLSFDSAQTAPLTVNP